MKNDWPVLKRIGVSFILLIMGPIHFGGELVDPLGNVHWHSIIIGLLGTYLWALLAYALCTLL